MTSPLLPRITILVLAALTAGCGTTKSQTATEQLLVSDAVDRAVASIDFGVLAGRTVFLDETYLKAIKTPVMVNHNYIVSSLRQQLFAANCLVQEKREEAEFVIEARVGALGTDGHDVTYGIPPTNNLSAAASLVANAPPLPILPDLSLAKRSTQSGAAKIAVFAYRRETREPIWQSGTALALSSAKDTWLLGAGPFQSGTIYDTPQFAGSRLHLPLLPLPIAEAPTTETSEPKQAFHAEQRFTDQNGQDQQVDYRVEQQHAEQPAENPAPAQPHTLQPN